MFFYNCNMWLNLDVILGPLLLTVALFFSKSINFATCYFREMRKCFIQSSTRYRLCLFSILSNAHIVDIEYPETICSPIFVVEDFSGFFAHPSILLIKDPKSASIYTQCFI